MMIIRQETPEDYEKIYELVKIAFQTAKVTNGVEQDYVNDLRKTDSYIPELSLVAEVGSELIGHIMLSKFPIHADAKDYPSLTLGPVCVSEKYRGTGIGSKLVLRSLELAKTKGFTSVFLVGDPEYYNRFGFSETAGFGINNTNGIPNKIVLCLELTEGALSQLSGTLTISF
ncbi:MAG: N-acetyltransferase [Candidatus Sumerlaeales bacterium]|nr:N-acetyltransferase [Candidatus Sumerlaeales bacterium]